MALNPKLQDWTDLNVWIIGGSSGIGRALAAALHRAGARVIVSARQVELLDDFVREHPGSSAMPLDVVELESMQLACKQIARSHGSIDLCVYCAGYYKPQRAHNFDLGEAMRHLQINYVGALNLLDALLPQLQLQSYQGRGAHLSLVSSVAGFRGLPKSLAYGPSKAALSHLAEALYLDLSPERIGVSVIHPGFVQTPLTAQNDFRMPALISPEEAAEAIIKGWAKGSFAINFPRRFTFWMKLLSLLPPWLYFRLVRRVTGL